VPRQPAGTDVVMIPAGSLDAEPPITPQARIFTGSRAAWSCADDALPTFPEAPRSIRCRGHGRGGLLLGLADPPSRLHELSHRDRAAGRAARISDPDFRSRRPFQPRGNSTLDRKSSGSEILSIGCGRGGVMP
jgi:hypothetical protein